MTLCIVIPAKAGIQRNGGCTLRIAIGRKRSFHLSVNIIQFWLLCLLLFFDYRFPTVGSRISHSTNQPFDYSTCFFLSIQPFNQSTIQLAFSRLPILDRFYAFFLNPYSIILNPVFHSSLFTVFRLSTLDVGRWTLDWFFSLTTHHHFGLS